MADVQNFSSAPQAVRSRPKYREDDPNSTGKNIMHDKRVVRGNTYASLVMPQQDNMAEIQKQREAQRRRLMRANQTKRRPGTPEAVMGRKHMDIQTDSYLEELTERTVEFEAETQTDFLLDRPPSPLFMPAKVGVDIETQIEEGELFDFDVGMTPDFAEDLEPRQHFKFCLDEPLVLEETPNLPDLQTPSVYGGYNHMGYSLACTPSYMPSSPACMPPSPSPTYSYMDTRVIQLSSLLQ